MSVWVLILFFSAQGVSVNSHSITTAEFTNERNCIAAGVAAQKLTGTDRSKNRNIAFACVPK